MCYYNPIRTVIRLNFGEKVLKYRTEHDMSLDDLSKIVGISKQAINRYELSQRVPKIDTAYMFAKAFNVPLENLIDDNLDLYSSPPIPGAFELNDTRRIPLLGRIAAGIPLYAEENLEGYIWTDKNHGGEYFGLRVVGDSMNAAGIKDGDIVVVRKQEEVQSHDIAVVRIDNDYATIKRIQQQGNIVILTPQSTNPENQPQMYDLKEHTVSIIGKVVESRTEF
jgi:repressor LexA